MKYANLFELLAQLSRINELLAQLLIFDLQKVQPLLHVSDLIQKHRAHVIVVVQVHMQVTILASGQGVTVLVLELFDPILKVLHEQSDVVSTVEPYPLHGLEVFIACD